MLGRFVRVWVRVMTDVPDPSVFRGSRAARGAMRPGPPAGPPVRNGILVATINFDIPRKITLPLARCCGRAGDPI
jgi:hypothetical protein